MALCRSLLVGIAAWATLQQVAQAQDDHAGHDHSAPAADEHAGHGDHPWEWAGVFQLDAGEVYTWSAFRGSGGSYAAGSMRLVMLAMTAGSTSAEAVATGAERLFAAPAEANATSGATLSLSGASNYRLVFDEESWLTVFYLRPPASGPYAFFAEHLPSEFENGFHFLKDEHGDDIEALSQGDGGDAAPVVAEVVEMSGVEHAIGGAAVSALPGLVMIAIVGPAIARMNPAIFSVLNSFSSGVIFSAAVFLLMPEALHMAGEGHDEAVAAAIWGVAIMCGWLVGVVSHHIGHQLQGGETPAEPAAEFDQEAAKEEAAKEEATKAAPRARLGCAARISATDRPIDLTVTLAVLFGDLWHNLVDGMIIGFSAKWCSTGAFWGVVGATLAHEAPQEVADFIVLMSKGGLHWGWATFFNSITAFPSSIIGAIIAHQAEVSSNWQGILLAFGAGIYLFVAITELAPSLTKVSGNVAQASAIRLLAFVIGAACIGLVLIDHTHCSPVSVAGAVADPHAGHGH